MVNRGLRTNELPRRLLFLEADVGGGESSIGDRQVPPTEPDRLLTLVVFSLNVYHLIELAFNF